MANLQDFLTDSMLSNVESAASLAIHSKNSEITPLHLFWALSVDSASLLNQIFNKMGISKEAVELEIKSKIAKLPTSSNVSRESVRLGSEFINSLESAKGLMSANGDSFLAVDTWLLSASTQAPIKDILAKFLDLNEFKKEIESLRAGRKIESKTGDETLDSLKKFGIDLSAKASEGKLDPVIGREEENRKANANSHTQNQKQPHFTRRTGSWQNGYCRGISWAHSQKRCANFTAK